MATSTTQQGLSEERVREIEERERMATDGPWLVFHGGDEWAIHASDTGDREIARVHLTENPWSNRGYGERDIPDATAQFIAKSRRDVPDLLAEVRRLQQENAAVREENAMLQAVKRTLEQINADHKRQIKDLQDELHAEVSHPSPESITGPSWTNSPEGYDA